MAITTDCYTRVTIVSEFAREKMVTSHLYEKRTIKCTTRSNKLKIITLNHPEMKPLTKNTKTNYILILLLFSSFLLAFPGFVNAQYIAKGRYVDSLESPIPFANILLLNSLDSTFVKGEITNESGVFSLATDKGGKYRVAVKFIGYEDYYSKEFTLNAASPTFEIGSIRAVEKAKELDGILVEAEKPLFEQKIDRMVINVESSIAASGGSVLDLLARSPGVTVDRMNNSVAMAGKQGVRVMINGKISQIPLEATIQMLEGMNADNIEKIELITTPPAKYEAEGDAGLINIVVKQQTDEGTNGNFSLFTGYGRKEKYGGNININNRSKKANVYGDYSFNNNVTEQLITADRIVNIAEGQRHIFTENNRSPFTRVHSGRVGVDWNISNKTTIGGIVSLSDRVWEMDAFANIKQELNGSNEGFVEMGTAEINEWTLLIGNLNIMHNFDDEQSLSLDIDRIDYVSNNPTNYSQRFFDESYSFSKLGNLTSRKETPIETWVGKVDYTKAIDKISFEAGAKASFSSLENDILVENIENGSVTIDEELTSYADMIENIGAGYVSATLDASDKIDLKLGLRYEHTITKINTLEEGNVVNRNFGGWFPSFFFQNTINENNSWVLSYSRRITRPSFFQIAPFVIFVDPYSFLSGNVKLLPSMTNALKAEYKYKSILLSLQYSHDKNSIAFFQPRTTPEGKQLGITENMDYRNNYSINLSLPFNITKWWEWQLNIAGNLINIRTDYLDLPVDLTIKNFTLNGAQKFSLPAKFTVEISGFYESKQLWGVSEMKAYGGVDFGLEKKFQNSQLRLAVTDIFDTNKWNFKTRISESNLNTQTLIDFETRVIRITYSKNFGNNKLKVKKRDATGSEEEQRRFQQ